MTRSQMIETVARKTGFTEAQVETTMDAMFDQIADCLLQGQRPLQAEAGSRQGREDRRSCLILKSNAKSCAHHAGTALFVWNSLGEGASPCGKASLFEGGGIALAMTEGVR